jgi:hypothetical protein
MNISELKQRLATVQAVNFRLPDGSLLPQHFHVTEIGLVAKHFIDCGGTERKEKIACFQLWEAGDYDHRLAAEKFLHIIDLSHKILGEEDMPIEIEYQQTTIGKFGLSFDGESFWLMPKQTACLAQDACGIPEKNSVNMADLSAQTCCTPGGGCC